MIFGVGATHFDTCAIQIYVETLEKRLLYAYA